MPWFKVDDNLAFHSKTVAAGNAAMGLWVRAGSWSAQQLTEGFVPQKILLTLGTPTQAQALVRCGLWQKTTGGYQFWQWNEEGRQPSKDKVLADREAARERQQRAREKAASRRDDPVTHAVSHAPVTPVVTVPPTRPDPTRLTHLSEVSGGGTTGPYCDRHPNGTVLPCGPCRTARLAFEARPQEKPSTPTIKRSRPGDGHKHEPDEHGNCPTCGERA